MRASLLGLSLCLAAGSVLLAQGAGKSVLFDHTHYEEAGTSAEWVICTGHEPDPYPAAPAKETDWNGGLSALGFDLYKQGYKVQTLPKSGGRITFGDATNAQDLSKYSVFFIPECYTRFTAAEKTAIMKFVEQGGGLFLVGNHQGSTRLSSVSGATDAFTVFNDLFASNGVANGGFGITFVAGHGPGDSRANTTSTAYTGAVNAATNAIIRGPNGTLTMQDFHSYAYLKVDTSRNASAQGLLSTQVSGDSSSNYFLATCTLGNGRVVVVSDSSPSDDGTTTTSGKSLHNSYTLYSNRPFFLNAVQYLAGGTQAQPPAVSISSPSAAVTVDAGDPVTFQAAASDPEGGSLVYNWSFGDGASSGVLGPVTHAYSAAGTYTATFTATDSQGLSASASRTVTVNATAPSTFTISASAGSNGTISPSGSVSVAGGGSATFTATPDAGYAVSSLSVDGVNKGALGTYTFSNVAANHTISAAFAPASAAGSLSETFDKGAKTAYTAANVTLATGSWNLSDTLLGNTSADHKSGSQALRMRNTGSAAMNFNFAGGARTVTVKHAVYGSDGSSTWALYYSTNGGSSWTQAGSTVTTSSTSLQTATFSLNVPGSVRFKLAKTGGGTNRLNLDDFQVAGY
jgi:hypothetical protein